MEYGGIGRRITKRDTKSIRLLGAEQALSGSKVCFDRTWTTKVNSGLQMQGMSEGRNETVKNYHE